MQKWDRRQIFFTWFVRKQHLPLDHMVLEYQGWFIMCAPGACYSQLLTQHLETQVSVKWHQYVWHPPDFLLPIIFVKPSYALLQHQHYCFSEVCPHLVLCQKTIAVELKRKAQVVFALCAGFLGKVTGEDSALSPHTSYILRTLHSCQQTLLSSTNRRDKSATKLLLDW